MSYHDKKISTEIIDQDISVHFREVFESDVWHRDRKDRIVLVLSSGWIFQFDNSLPQDLEIGDIIKIPKGVFHRALTKSAQSLKLIIIELT